MSPARTSLDAWLAAKLGLGRQPRPADLAAWQLEQLNATLAHADQGSPFYRRRLASWDGRPLTSLAQLAELPFTTSDDLRQSHRAMLCLSQDDVARVVTLPTSGTTAPAKRVYFSAGDLETTIDFFQHGMATLTRPGQTVLIGLPGPTPDSVGDLLAQALARMGALGLVHGPLADPGAALELIQQERASCLVAIPMQALALARHPDAARARGLIKSALLTTDYVPRAVSAALRQAWGCEVFEHYGMTEMGLGGGVECGAHAGYHLRAADLLVEVVEPASGRPLPLGQEGELVFTTLTRRALPLIRYRSGDRARLLAGVCPCGSWLPRLEPIPGRLGGAADLGAGESLPLGLVDEALLALPGLLDYRARIEEEKGRRVLRLSLLPVQPPPADLTREATRALGMIPQVARALAGGGLVLAPPCLVTQGWISRGTAKRAFDTD